MFTPRVSAKDVQLSRDIYTRHVPMELFSYRVNTARGGTNLGVKWVWANSLNQLTSLHDFN